MTYNVDEGTDFLEIQNVTAEDKFLLGVGEIIAEVRASSPPARMRAVAKQILAARPMLVSLQELDQWYSGSFNPQTQQCGALTLEFDMLQELLAALSAQGASYEVAVRAQQYHVVPPEDTGLSGCRD